MTLHIALDGFYVNVNHIIVQKLVEELLRNSHWNPYIINFEQELGSD